MELFGYTVNCYIPNQILHVNTKLPSVPTFNEYEELISSIFDNWLRHYPAEPTIKQTAI